jgi:RNA polymerase sigma-70 factor (ECF subfamily)
MKYVMLIYQGPALERQAALPEEEQKQVYADYQGINQTQGVTPGLPMGLPENATTVRVEGGKTLTTDGPFVGMKEAVGGDQDRSRWNTGQIAAGRAELDRALALRGRGSYVLQAAIASLHAEVPCDWAQIAALYGELTRLTGSPVVELNRAIAVAETEGPEAGLRIAGQLGLDDFSYLHSTRAELLRRLGRTVEARDAYRRARQLTDEGAERRFLERRLTEIAGTTGPG